MDVRTTFTALYSSNAFVVGTTAIQVSGPGPFSSVANGFYPARNRACVRFVNNNAVGSGIVLYVGSVPGITPGAAGGWFKAINPGDPPYDDYVGGFVPRYLVASASGCNAVQEEYA